MAPSPVAALKRGRDLAVGDVIGSRGGESRTITRLTPYPSPHLFDFMDERWRIAYSGEWGITVGPDEWWRQSVSDTWAPAHHLNTDGTWIQ
jgi:hypothetical protein